MALKFWKWLRGESGDGAFREVRCKELFDAAADYTLRKLSFDVCVDMIANAVGRCEFRTYRGWEEIREKEYWLWNVAPGVNENSTAFLHKLIDRLYRGNEALVISLPGRSGDETLAVADAWLLAEPQVSRQNEYQDVTVGALTFRKTFRESEVLHFRLNQEKMKPVTDALGDSWARMASLAMKHYRWDRGQHWKVHVDQMAAGAKDFDENFAAMVAAQVKPFLDSDNAVLPEFNGYDYQKIGAASSAAAKDDTRDIRAMADDIFDFTARGFLIPAVLVNGKVEATADANNRFLTYVVDPLCDQLQEEITRKRYGFDEWAKGNYLRVDSSSILHYDLFSQAASVEKLIGSGVYSINDILRAAGQATINEPWADEHYMTLNIKNIEAVLQSLGLGAQKGGSE